MKRLMVAMFRPNTSEIPAPRALSGFRVRWFEEGDEDTWSRIEYQAAEFPSELAAKERFLRDFRDPDWLADHCFFIENHLGEAVGTAMAMSGIFAGKEIGRLGWVAVIPAYQGKGLGKWLISLAMHRIAQENVEMYLTTQTTSATAVGIYSSYGFRPYPYGNDDAEAWSLLSKALGRELRMSGP